MAPSLKKVRPAAMSSPEHWSGNMSGCAAQTVRKKNPAKSNFRSPNQAHRPECRRRLRSMVLSVPTTASSPAVRAAPWIARMPKAFRFRFQSNESGGDSGRLSLGTEPGVGHVQSDHNSADEDQ